MSYTLKDDEVAILLRPVEFDEYGEWSGELSTALSVGPTKRSNEETIAYLVHLATLMGTFLEMAQTDEDLYDLVEEKRNELIGVDNDRTKEYEEVEGTNGKVVRLTRFTKTQGNA
tara:strand:+ start:1110 stop:1454 length:345 start_codon:yes stop_codon:yes gene_type:complete